MATNEGSFDASTRPATEVIGRVNLVHRSGPVPIEPLSDAEIRERAKFPRTQVVLEIAELANKCTIAARALDRLAALAPTYEVGTLRRQAHGVVRILVSEIAKAGVTL